MTATDMLFSTGLPGLDIVLSGGINRHSLVVIVGAPGAGKTVLASQIIFNAARQGLQTLVFTSYSEGSEQYIEHMSSLSFFEASLLGDRVQILTLISQLASEDAAPANAIARTIRTTGVKMVLIDGFQGADPLLPDGLSMRAVLSALATQIRYLDVTILVTMAGEVRDPRFHTEMTVADVAIGLSYTVEGRRHQRLLEVVKLRGRAQRSGLHSYSIDDDGVHVFPRIEGHLAPQQRPFTAERAAFNLPELDRLLGGGPNVGTSTLLAGAPGVGKTTLALYWAMAEAQPDAKSLFLTFVEHLEQLQHKAAVFGLDLQGAIERGSVRVIRLSPVDVDPDRVAHIVLSELESGQIHRLIFDDIAVLLHELGDRARDYLSALNDIIYGAQVTSLYLLEIAPFDGLRVDLTNTPLAVLGDNVIVVQQYEIAGALRRLLAVLRMRMSFFDRTIRELVLDEIGVKVLAPEESMLGLLATGAQLSGGVAPADVGREPANAPDKASGE